MYDIYEHTPGADQQARIYYMASEKWWNLLWDCVLCVVATPHGGKLGGEWVAHLRSHSLSIYQFFIDFNNKAQCVSVICRTCPRDMSGP